MEQRKYSDLLLTFVSHPGDKPDLGYYITHFDAFRQCLHTSSHTFMTDQYLSICHFCRCFLTEYSELEKL